MVKVIDSFTEGAVKDVSWKAEAAQIDFSSLDPNDTVHVFLPIKATEPGTFQVCDDQTPMTILF